MGGAQRTDRRGAGDGEEPTPGPKSLADSTLKTSRGPEKFRPERETTGCRDNHKVVEADLSHLDIELGCFPPVGDSDGCDDHDDRDDSEEYSGAANRSSEMLMSRQRRQV